MSRWNLKRILANQDDSTLNFCTASWKRPWLWLKRKFGWGERIVVIGDIYRVKEVIVHTKLEL